MLEVKLIRTSLTPSRFPCVLPFSQMYPLCCIDIRNFLNQFYFFSDDHFQQPNVIDETLKKVRKQNMTHGGLPVANAILSPWTSYSQKRFASL